MRWVMVLAGLAFVAPAWTQEQELLWRVDNTASPTTAPAYGGWATPFNLRPKNTTPETSAPEDAERAAAIAAAQAEAQALAQKQAEESARRKVTGLMSQLNVVAARISLITPDAVMQGPEGGSMLWRGRWYPQGTQIAVPTAVAVQASKMYQGLQHTDPAAAVILYEKIQQRLAKQTTISVTLTGVTSATALFTDGRQRYTRPVRQPPL